MIGMNDFHEKSTRKRPYRMVTAKAIKCFGLRCRSIIFTT